MPNVIDLPTPTYVGTEVTTKTTFRTPARARPVDPTTITLKIQDGNNNVTVWTYGSTGYIVRTAQGLYLAQVLLTSPGTWSLEWLGTGACATGGVVSFPVTALPF